MCQLVITFFILCKILLTCHYFFYISVSYCPIPPSVANGYIIQSSGVKYGGNVTYKCNDGFIMVRTDNIQCKSDGTWELPPDCSGKYLYSFVFLVPK
jgi:hypothetical protein